MANVHYGVSLTLEFYKVRFSDIYFFIYKNNLTENLQSNSKFFANDTSLLAIINHPNATAKQLCVELDKIKELIFQWKTNFNPDPSKHAQEIIFTLKIKNVVYPPIFFNDKIRMFKIRCSINFFRQTSSTSFITKTIGSYIRHIFNI